MILRIADEAKIEARTAMEYFENVQPGLGRAFSMLYEERLRSIEESPESFPKYDHGPVDADIRFTVLRRFRFVIYFELSEEEVVVHAVGHGSRKPGYWLRRRRAR